MLLVQNDFKPDAAKKGIGEFLESDFFNVIWAGKQSNSIIIFNLQTRKLIHKLTRHTKRVTGLCLCGQKKLVSIGEDKRIIFWDLHTGISLNSSYNGYCLKILKNGDLATGSGINAIIIWDMAIFKTKFTLFSHLRKSITCLEQLSNEWLVSGGIYNDTIEIWDLNKRVCVRVIYSSNSIDSYDKALFRTYFREAGRVTCLKGFEMKTDDKIECFFASGSSSGFLGIWNASNGSCVKGFPNFMPGEISSLELRSNDELLCSSERGVYSINLKTYEQSILEKIQCFPELEAKYGHEIMEQIRKITNGKEDLVELYPNMCF